MAPSVLPPSAPVAPSASACFAVARQGVQARRPEDGS